VDARLFRTILLGGSKPPQIRPANVIATYGLTETGSGVVYDGYPLNGVDIRIADDGEILVDSPMNMRCYRDGTTSIDSDGWLHTNDIGSLSPTGQLSVHGRMQLLPPINLQSLEFLILNGASALSLPPLKAICLSI
jgi:O-succinylbenzoic acid--CoA ligase